MDPTQTYLVFCLRNLEASAGHTKVRGVHLSPGGFLLNIVPALDLAIGDTQLRYEAVGNLITAGWKTNPPYADFYGDSDVFLSYTRFYADAWRTSDWTVVAKSGIAVTDANYDGGIIGRFNCAEYYFDKSASCPRPWDFANGEEMDVVTMNSGPNDFAAGNTFPSAETLRFKYVQLLQRMRDVYPNALIIPILPVIYSCFYASGWDTMRTELEGAVSDLQAQGDGKLGYIFTGTRTNPPLDCREDYMDYTHPTDQGSVKLASSTLEAMTALVAQRFPHLCRVHPADSRLCQWKGIPPSLAGNRKKIPPNSCVAPIIRPR